MNYIFISYAGEDREIAQNLANEINKELSGLFYTELVENLREGDTTFTEKVINYFKKCNIFIVILTENSLENQFVNQEWGYAKCLKEFGQIQILLHVTEKKHGDERIKSRGFISSNMDFIDIQYDESNNPDISSMHSQIIEFLKSKEEYIIPIFTEKQQKLKRFLEEIKYNIILLDEFINNEGDFWENLSINHLIFSYDYALHFLQIGHLFPKDILDKTEKYIEVLKNLNIQKEFMIFWAISQRKLHEGNTRKFYKSLSDNKYILSDSLKMAEREYIIFK